MSLIKKIFLAFAVLVVIAVVSGVYGWRTVGDMNATLNKLVEYELSANDQIAEMQTALQGLTASQRTLLNVNMLTDAREFQHDLLSTLRQSMTGLNSSLAELLARGMAEIQGWDRLSSQWDQVRGGVASFLVESEKGEEMIREWEKTTILNPDALLRNIQSYRGDHYALASRLGEMIARGAVSGAEISAADNICAFGRWRTSFDGGNEVFSKNPNLQAAMRAMTEPHRHFHQTAHDVYTLLAEDPEANRERITSAYLEHLQYAGQVISTFQQIVDEADKARVLNERADFFVMGELRELRNSVQESLAQFSAANDRHTQNVVDGAVLAGRASVFRMGVLVVGAMAMGLAVVFLLYRTMRARLTGPLGRVISGLVVDAGHVSSEAHGVATAAAALSQGSSEQASSLEETSAAIEEITSMARRNLENAQSANASMRDNAQQIADSTAAVARMSTAMGEIRESSEKIGNILKSIEEIAFQTNLLALNAAVEAARAGEAGKGFAVVADEVRNLAQRSAQAVKDTSELITGTVERVHNGVRITSEIEEYFASITSSTERIARMIAEIDVATGEQTQGMEQINQAVQQIDQVNQENAKHAENNASASVNLNERSGNLNRMIDELGLVLVNVVGKGGAAALNAAGAGDGNGGGNGEGHDMVRARVVANPGLKALPPPRN